MKALIIDDDPSIGVLVKTIMNKDGYEVDAAQTAKEGERMALTDEYGVIILDLGLPDGEGIELCENIREEDITTPVLILSDDQQTDMKVQCLRVGADDYLTKPFDKNELMARVEAVTRRADSQMVNQVLSCGSLEVRMLEREFHVHSTQVDLTNNEYNLLVYLLKNKNEILSQEQIAKNVWDIHFDTQTNYINVYISYLRKKIRSHADREYIDTVRKKGFTIRCND